MPSNHPHSQQPVSYRQTRFIIRSRLVERTSMNRSGPTRACSGCRNNIAGGGLLAPCNIQFVLQLLSLQSLPSSGSAGHEIEFAFTFILLDSCETPQSANSFTRRVVNLWMQHCVLLVSSFLGFRVHVKTPRWMGVLRQTSARRRHCSLERWSATHHLPSRVSPV